MVRIQSWAMWGSTFRDQLLQDLRYTMRAMLKNTLVASILV